mmetsp:Transcript_8158/g.24426  ORF Transcript_8158/g.24426 Transcript_8158/m.24426 type:complete len:680 (+) Transcript_8158:327-2366(+)
MDGRDVARKVIEDARRTDEAGAAGGILAADEKEPYPDDFEATDEGEGEEEGLGAAMLADAASALATKDDELPPLPDELFCPITYAMMRDPVRAADGHVYDRLAITRWFAQRLASPMTGAALASAELEALPELRDRIYAWAVARRGTAEGAAYFACQYCNELSCKDRGGCREAFERQVRSDAAYGAAARRRRWIEGHVLPSAERALRSGPAGAGALMLGAFAVGAVGALVGGVRGKILCLVGPPGTGKTSVGRSVAAALGRAFYRFSVGGLGDVAEIKGHRRTYVGAMPGKPVQCLKATQVTNPVILIDEVDKLGRGGGSGGDPASALLELLDPSQNSTFLDHYLDVPVDLSRCLFVCTANDASLIPGPLLDRMEVVRLSGYDLRDKLEIARRHLVPRAFAEAGLDESLEVTDGALAALVRGHAREAGVRTLQKLVEQIARKLALRTLRARSPEAAATAPEGDAGLELVVDEATLPGLVGQPKFSKDRLYDAAPPAGVVMGLAWTSMGGAALYVEAAATANASSEAAAPSLKATGQLGGVMEESTRVALSYARARLRGSGHTLDGLEIHLHVPDGATPKDGPSAGVTIATALLSLATGTPARADLAMTGEISLTGKVMPVGGIKEKVIAARRAAVDVVVLPAENRRDYDELPGYLKEDLEVVFAETYDDVAAAAFPAGDS